MLLSNYGAYDDHMKSMVNAEDLADLMAAILDTEDVYAVTRELRGSAIDSTRSKAAVGFAPVNPGVKERRMQIVKNRRALAVSVTMHGMGGRGAAGERW